MDFKIHTRFALEQARGFTEQLLESFQTADDWFYQAHPKANHALWIVGHLSLADNAFLSRFREDLARKPDGWDELFWFGSELKDDRSVYPATDEVLSYFRDRRTTLMQVFDELTEEQLSVPAPTEKSPIAGAPSLGQLFLFAAFHEGVHCGQLTVAHRGIGQPPLFGRK